MRQIGTFLFCRQFGTLLVLVQISYPCIRKRRLPAMLLVGAVVVWAEMIRFPPSPRDHWDGLSCVLQRVDKALLGGATGFVPLKDAGVVEHVAKHHADLLVQDVDGVIRR